MVWAVLVDLGSGLAIVEGAARGIGGAGWWLYEYGYGMDGVLLVDSVYLIDSVLPSVLFPATGQSWPNREISHTEDTINQSFPSSNPFFPSPVCTTWQSLTQLPHGLGLLHGMPRGVPHGHSLLNSTRHLTSLPLPLLR
jgi:hypothetical protein